jgi:antitoxin VapB
MAFHVRDAETDALVRALARKRGCGLTDAVKQAVAAELRRADAATPLRERLRALQDEIAALPDSGLDADKRFYDELSGHAD